jgi:c-di-GMP-binding flagellar brake protein YcgR
VLRLFGLTRKAKKTQKRALLPEHQRATVRLDVTVPGQWRYAAGGKATGEYLRGALTDLSRTGASLTVEREAKMGTQIELKFSIGTSAQPMVMLCQVMRASKIEASGKMSLGLRFHGVTPDEDRAIMEFINKRQAERRSRGLA